MKTPITELVPTSGRKSFYGKAKVIEIDGTRFLKSYDTVVGCVDGNGKAHRYVAPRTRTTASHVKSFCEAFAKISHKEFWDLPVEACPELKVVI